MLMKSKTLISHVLQKQVSSLLLQASCRHLSSEGNLYSQDGYDSGYLAPLGIPRKDLKKNVPMDKSKVYDACWQSMRRTEYKCRSDPEFNVHAFIDYRKKCLADPCATEVDAMDLTHYKPSDMHKRKYPRTWYECVVKRRKRKAHCVPIAPPMPRRKRKVVNLKPKCPENLCVLGKLDLKLTEPCKLMKPTKCPRFKMPNCSVAARNPPKCRKPFRRCGSRRKTKYPSFSECKRDPFSDARPIECNCLLKPAICDMWRHYRRRNG
ncbi:uncharacterized protein LOC108105751 [Drosophila eugracilis]|uniref:uncharacterized protein LOC108105751 n=1 Tax=Drosophila eugracilis TaxID=29029 RepID=UPI0007E5D47E|nr:uncharacterized protein LOC108105751 [Drosophila eugracilis]